jgi:ABC-type sugar transport system ATPase subunit
MPAADVQLDAVTFRVGDFAMEALALGVAGGEYFVITGPNGSGKTILVKLVAGLLCPEQGAIRIGGERMNETPPWRRQIGYVPQEGLLFPNRTVRGNIEFGLEVRRVGGPARTEAVVRVADILGIAPLLERSVEGLSGGERQRAALARALVLEPRVLLLDEPVSSIDEASRDGLCRELRRIQRTLGLTVIQVSHNAQEIGLVADRVAVMERGRVKSVTARERTESPA